MPVLIYDVRPRQLTIEVSPLSTPINTMPAAALQGLAETLPYQQDYTNVLLPGETITAITSSLNDTTNGANTPVTLADPPTQPTAAVIQQIVRGGALTAGHTYRLATVATVVANVKVWAAYTEISCPF